MKILTFLVLFVILTHAKSYTYFLPKDSKELESHVKRLILTSNISIDVAMYNFSHKKYAKLLNNAVKQDIEVNVIFDKNKTINDKKSKYDYLKGKGINTFIADKKMHLKMAMFDKKVVLFGSLNWSKASFEDNYEIIYITDDIDVVNKSKEIFLDLKSNSNK